MVAAVAVDVVVPMDVVTKVDVGIVADVVVVVVVVVAVDVLVVEAGVVLVELVTAAVDVVVRIVNDVENVWLLSLGLGVTALFGMLITLFMVDDSDQELETLLLVCHIPCYVSLF